MTGFVVLVVAYVLHTAGISASPNDTIQAILKYLLHSNKNSDISKNHPYTYE